MQEAGRVTMPPLAAARRVHMRHTGFAPYLVHHVVLHRAQALRCRVVVRRPRQQRKHLQGLEYGLALCSLQAAESWSRQAIGSSKVTASSCNISFRTARHSLTGQG
jgi:hypothetical protein